MQVLNAQLQAVYSLRKYVAKTHDASAAMLARRLQRAATATLPQFDTGYWTYYSLPSRLSNLHYQDYVVRLLRKLSSADPRFADAATRFAAYRRQPPAIRLAEGRLGELRFWLSKPARTTVSAGGRTQRFWLGGGWRTLSWTKPRRGGIYPIALSAVDVVGNRASFQALPLVRVAHGARTRAVRATSSRTHERPALLVGAALHDPFEAFRAQRLGLRLMRIRVGWPTGASRPELALTAAFQPLAGASTLVELRVRRLPATHREKRALAKYAAAVAQLVPGLRQFSLAPAARPKTAAAYAAALTAVRKAVQAELPGVAVGPLVDARRAPKRTLTALRRALRTKPDVVIVRRATPESIPTLEKFVGRTPVLIDGLATPKRTYAGAITDLACAKNVTGVVLDRLVGSTVGAACCRRRRARPARNDRLPRARVEGGGEHARLPEGARSQGSGSRATRLCPRLPVPGDARRRARPPRRRAEGLAPRRKPRADARAAEDDARPLGLPARCAARRPGQSGRGHAADERSAARQPGAGSSFDACSCVHCRGVVSAKS